MNKPTFIQNHRSQPLIKKVFDSPLKFIESASYRTIIPRRRYEEQRCQIWHPNWFRLAPNETNLWFLKDQFQYIWLGEPKCTETDLKNLFHLGSIGPNLEAKFDIPTKECYCFATVSGQGQFTEHFIHTRTRPVIS